MGVLEVLPEGWGLLRRGGFAPGGWDVYVPQSQIVGFALKTGDTIIGRVRAPKETEQYPVLSCLDSLNGVTIQH